MPFTFSHPAVVLPFWKISRKYLSFTGLIVGSMVPDFEFFLKMKTGPNVGHHFFGIFFFDIPLALILCFIFHKFLKRPLFIYSPDWFGRRVTKYIDFDWPLYALRHILVVIISIIVGIITHLFFDAFTHHDGFFVERIDFFKKIYTLMGMDIAVFSIAQVLISLIGLFIVVAGFFKMPKTKKCYVYKNGKSKYWCRVFLLASFLFFIRSLALSHYWKFWDHFMGGMGAFIYALILVSIVEYYKTSSNAGG